MVVVRGQEGMGLVRLIFAAVERIFPLVLIPPLQVCVHCFSIMKYSLNPSTAVPLVLCDSRALYRLDLHRLWALACALSKPYASSHSLQRFPSFARALLHSFLQNPSFFLQLTLSCSFHLYLSPWPHPRTPPPFPPSCCLPVRITVVFILIIF